MFHFAKLCYIEILLHVRERDKTNDFQDKTSFMFFFYRDASFSETEKYDYIFLSNIKQN